MELKEIISSGLLELHVLGLASGDENAQVLRWAAEFPEVQEEINEIRQAMENYALAHALPPDPSVKQKVLEQIKPGREESKGYPDLPAAAKIRVMPAHFRWLVAAGLILLMASVITGFVFYNKYRSVSADLQLVQNELDKQKEANAGMSQDMHVVTDKNTQPVVLKGTPHAPDAVAKIFWVRNTGDVYVDPTHLPPPAAGRQYQLWAIVDGKPVDAGMISTKKGVYTIQKMKSFGRAEAFAITLEKEGGSPTPTMDEMYVISKI